MLLVDAYWRVILDSDLILRSPSLNIIEDFGWSDGSKSLDERIGVSDFSTSTDDCFLGLLDVGIWGILFVTDDNGLLGLNSCQGSDGKSENSGDNGKLHDYGVKIVLIVCT